MKKKTFAEVMSKLSSRKIIIHLIQSTINGCFYHHKFTQRKPRTRVPSDSPILPRFNQLVIEVEFESRSFDCKARLTINDTSGCLLLV